MNDKIIKVKIIKVKIRYKLFCDDPSKLKSFINSIIHFPFIFCTTPADCGEPSQGGKLHACDMDRSTYKVVIVSKFFIQKLYQTKSSSTNTGVMER